MVEYVFELALYYVSWNAQYYYFKTVYWRKSFI